MKERLVNFSLLVSGHIVQDVVITDDSITGEELVNMLERGEAFTSVHEDNDVILPDGTVIGNVRWSDTEVELTDFQMEGGSYEQESVPAIFNASRLAWAAAYGEFIAPDEDMDIGEMHHILTLAGDTTPLGLTVEEGYRDLTGRQLLREIELMQHGLMNLMTIAHAAGKKGQEIK